MSSPSMQVNPDREIVATIVLHRPAGAADTGERLLSGTFEAGNREQAEQAMSASAQDLGAVRRFVAEHGMRVVVENAAARTVRVEGSIRQMEAAFGVSMQQRRDDAGHEYLSHDGEVKLPEPLAGIVEAVLGLDRRPVARSHGG